MFNRNELTEAIGLAKAECIFCHAESADIRRNIIIVKSRKMKKILFSFALFSVFRNSATAWRSYYRSTMQNEKNTFFFCIVLAYS